MYTAIAAICAACMNINKVPRVKIGGPGTPRPPRFLRLCKSGGLYPTSFRDRRGLAYIANENDAKSVISEYHSYFLGPV